MAYTDGGPHRSPIGHDDAIPIEAVPIMDVRASSGVSGWNPQITSTHIPMRSTTADLDLTQQDNSLNLATPPATSSDGDISTHPAAPDECSIF
ncbi:hypothetical protein VE01_02382 [Pseudogymnoascus verrucosus]|uniref:Uncharacterized protein n=1 Tax=Pseudogymnoascus verrucosus TaxID=342668 RepID=A0A1B8GT65_9PEZI|nr:uncharacterized protein VE01_02382 [Pseudogymnoascus verrucosus]OBT99032.1 hypothetical protein VE01_02382 [Pseudogymnoascus verrucosus]